MRHTIDSAVPVALSRLAAGSAIGCALIAPAAIPDRNEVALLGLAAVAGSIGVAATLAACAERLRGVTVPPAVWVCVIGTIAVGVTILLAGLRATIPGAAGTPVLPVLATAAVLTAGVLGWLAWSLRADRRPGISEPAEADAVGGGDVQGESPAWERAATLLAACSGPAVVLVVMSIAASVATVAGPLGRTASQELSQGLTASALLLAIAAGATLLSARIGVPRTRAGTVWSTVTVIAAATVPIALAGASEVIFDGRFLSVSPLVAPLAGLAQAFGGMRLRSAIGVANAASPPEREVAPEVAPVVAAAGAVGWLTAVCVAGHIIVFLALPADSAAWAVGLGIGTLGFALTAAAVRERLCGIAVPVQVWRVCGLTVLLAAVAATIGVFAMRRTPIGAFDFRADPLPDGFVILVGGLGLLLLEAAFGLPRLPRSRTDAFARPVADDAAQPDAAVPLPAGAIPRSSRPAARRVGAMRLANGAATGFALTTVAMCVVVTKILLDHGGERAWWLYDVINVHTVVAVNTLWPAAVGVALGVSAMRRFRLTHRLAVGAGALALIGLTTVIISVLGYVATEKARDSDPAWIGLSVVAVAFGVGYQVIAGILIRPDRLPAPEPAANGDTTPRPALPASTGTGRPCG
jgi:hypothetical protein